MAIHVLDKHTAELIAAGEVVERPASVVKELLENAIDAGATSLRVAIERGGTTFIQVEDNGSGIDAEDIPLAFLRHATSKVRTEQDLDSISTLGFRGEALASICSVARVELLTKTDADEFASLYAIHGGEEHGIEAAARGRGTTITVRDLFYNTPARMKFLKKDVTEGGYITETVTRIALSHPEVAVRYTRDGKEVFGTPGDGELASAAWAVLGKDFARELVPVDGVSRQYSVNGLITKPSAARASRSMQFFFINGRFVKNRTMMAALEQAYRGMLMGGKFPGCVLFLQMPPQLVDVNVHPAKTEVRFAFEKEIFEAVYSAVKSTLTEAASTHRQFQLEGEEATPDQTPEPVVKEEKPQTPPPANTAFSGFALPKEVLREPPPSPKAVQTYNETVATLASENSFAPYETQKPKPVYEWGLTIEPEEQASPQPVLPVQEPPAIEETQAEPPEQTSLVPELEQDSAPELRLVGEVFKTYILAQLGDVLCVIDKHAAHERIIYEQLAAAHGDTGAQQLLAPVNLTLGAAEKDALLQNGEALAAAGIEVDDFGGNEVLVRGVPADVEPDSVTGLVTEVAGRLALNSNDNLNEKTEWVLHSVSCRAAVKAGDRTQPEELLCLAADILAGKVPPFCPHGRPVVLEIPRKELEKQFGRLG